MREYRSLPSPYGRGHCIGALSYLIVNKLELVAVPADVVTLTYPVVAVGGTMKNIRSG
jgi:hypothetical protein